VTDGWHRLHPLSPAIRAGRALIAIAVIFLPTLVGGGTSRSDLLWHVVAIAALLVLGVVAWLTTRWRIEDGDLRIEKGLVRRSSLRYPLSQVQAIDTVRPGLARLFGLAELRLRMGGTGGAARLAYLPDADAERLRARLLALSRGAHEDEPEPQERVLLRIPTRRVLGSVLLSGGMIALVTYVALLVVLRAVDRGAAAATFRASFVFLFGDALALWRVVNRTYGATIAEAPEGIRVRAGLVATTAETIPRGRVQAVQVVEPFLWRPLGWRRLAVDVAGRVREHGDEERGNRQLRAVLPVGTRADAERLLALLVPGAPPADARPPRRAGLKSPLRYRRLRFAYDERYAVTAGGRLARVVAWVPLQKVQSLRRVEGPVQRGLRLATVHLDTAGRNVRAALRDVDAAASQEHLDRLTELARAARRR
jgi:putative membrane protein